jgi:hypothetical protein
MHKLVSCAALLAESLMVVCHSATRDDKPNETLIYPLLVNTTGHELLRLVRINVASSRPGRNRVKGVPSADTSVGSQFTEMLSELLTRYPNIQWRIQALAERAVRPQHGRRS